MSLSITHLGETIEKESKNFPCSGCGAALIYCAGIQKLKCQYCDGEHDISTSRVPGEALEIELTELIATKPAKMVGKPRVLDCDQCGAKTSVDGLKITAKCAFCASELVQERDASSNKMAPAALLPFKVEREAAVKSFRSWVSTLWFRPNDLRKLAKIAGIEGIYTPFWTFDAHAQSRWTGESGHYYYERESYKDDEGKTQTREVQRTRWEPASGRRGGEYDDVLICGSKGLSAELLRRVEPFDTLQSLVTYDPRFLAGWAAEEYAVEPGQAWLAGKERIFSAEYDKCANDVPGDTHRNLQVSTDLRDKTGKHILLPVWVAAYQFRGKSYRFLVNGETGMVSGEAPWSWYKIISVVIVAVFILWMLSSK